MCSVLSLLILRMLVFIQSLISDKHASSLAAIVSHVAPLGLITNKRRYRQHRYGKTVHRSNICVLKQAIKLALVQRQILVVLHKFS